MLFTNCSLTYPMLNQLSLKTRNSYYIERDYDLLLISAKAHPTARYISQIASHTSWRKIWDNALDYGVKGTISCQALLRELSRPTFGDGHLCGDQISSFPLHLCNDHPSLVCHTSLSSVVSKVSSLDMKFIITVGSKLISLAYPNIYYLFIFVCIAYTPLWVHCKINL